MVLAAKPDKTPLLDGMEMNDDHALPETDLLYQRDSGLRSVEARVVGLEPESRLVALDRTVVFPGGGGQPADAGMLTRLADNRQWPVVAARKAGGIVWHELGGDEPLPEVAERVRVDLDWERRYRLMRMHTALHVLCGVVFRDYGALVTGGNMGPDRARMDFEMDSADFTPQRVAEIERRANEELRAGRDVDHGGADGRDRRARPAGGRWNTCPEHAGDRHAACRRDALEGEGEQAIGNRADRNRRIQ
jgi:Ser-tRNA(Ala) deacylase AlaX